MRYGRRPSEMSAPARPDGLDRPPKRAPPTARPLPFEILRYSIRSGALLIACLAAALFDLAHARRATKAPRPSVCALASLAATFMRAASGLSAPSFWSISV